MIRIENLSKNYRIGNSTVAAVDNVSLTVERGDFTAILGHSGSGKTTLLNLIGGLTRPDAGAVVINDANIWQISDNDLSRLRNEKMNFIFQFSSLIPTLTTLENVLLPATFGEKKDAGLKERALNLLDIVGMSDKTASFPAQLSGGQQRRVAIARAFVNEPEIIFADEPTGDLDEETEQEVVNLFKKINAERETTFLIVTHSSDLAAQTRKQYTMKNGVLMQRN